MRQKPIGEYIVDFYCGKLNLVLEVDGDSHSSDRAFKRDFEKDRFLTKIGITVLRFDDLDIKTDIDLVLSEIIDWIEEVERKNEGKASN